MPSPTLTNQVIRGLLEDFYPSPDEALLSQISVYLDLLVRWNARTNLTAIRDPNEMVRRHFGESLFLARHLPPCSTLLDLGSGAGFPGLPIQLVYPDLAVTLAESQHKKAAFLREAIRSLGLPTTVWGSRAEDIPKERRFGVVAMRAVDNPTLALELAQGLVSPGGHIIQLTSEALSSGEGTIIPIPGSKNSVLHLVLASEVPRGTLNHPERS